MAIIVSFGYYDFLVTDEEAAAGLTSALPFIREVEPRFPPGKSEPEYHVRPTVKFVVQHIADEHIVWPKPPEAPATFAEVAEVHDKPATDGKDVDEMSF